MSLLDWNGYSEKTFVGFSNYANIFTKDTTFWSSLGNTLRIGLIGFPISIALGLIFAALLSRVIRGRRFLQTANFLPYITTPVAIGMMFTFIFEQHVGFFNKIFVLYMPKEEQDENVPDPAEDINGENGKE